MNQTRAIVILQRAIDDLIQDHVISYDHLKDLHLLCIDACNLNLTGGFKNGS